MTRLRWLFRRRTNVDLTREIDAHIAERVDDLIEDGVAPDEARARARRELGNRTLQIERSREVWIAPWLSSVWQDLRYAVRSLVRQPGFALGTIGVLSIGIGLITALFTIFNGFVLQPWRVPNPSSLALVVPGTTPGQPASGLMSAPEYHYLREQSRSFSHLASWMPSSMTGVIGSRVSYRDAAKGVDTAFVSANYFDALRIDMQIGRGFLREEEDYVVPRAVAIISDRLWRDFFGASESIVGDVIRIDDHPFTVVGVARRGFRDVGNMPVDLWMPLPSVALGRAGPPASVWLQRFKDPAASHQFVVGRLARGVTRADAQAELAVLSAQFRTSQSLPPSYGLSVYDTRPLSTVDRAAVGRQAAGIGLVFGALFLVLLLACANVGNLILARGLSRQREIAIRLSLGAGRARVTRQLLTESLVISLAAGAVALWIASLVPPLIERFVGGKERLAPDALVFGVALLLALLACLASGLLPALRSTRINLAARASERHAGSGAGRLRTTLLAAQIAVSMLLLVGAGLLTRTIGHVLSSGPGFAIHEVQALDVRFPGGANPDRRSAFGRAFRDALKAGDLPSVASSDFTAITRAYRAASIRREGESRGAARTLPLRSVSTDYFKVLQIPLVAGRPMSDDEHSSEVVVSESAAKLFWPGESALGKRLVSSMPPAAAAAIDPRDDLDRFHVVVGVARDVPVVSLTGIEPAVYWSGSPHYVFYVRDLSPAIVEQIAATVRSIEPEASVSARPLAEDLRNPIGGLVMGSRFAWAIGLVALVLATIGALGVFAYVVEERRREIGVRMALGARARQVVWTVVGGVRWPLIVGLGTGLLLSMVAAQLLRGVLYGLSPFDPITYLGIAAILVVAALLATWIPARRATRIDPAITLRGD